MNKLCNFIMDTAIIAIVFLLAAYALRLVGVAS